MVKRRTETTAGDPGKQHRAVDLMPALGGAFYRARAKIPDVLRRAFDSGDLGPRHVGAINAVAVEGCILVGELGKRLGVGTPAASQLVTELESEGWLVRRQDERDRRKFWVIIADDRRAAIEAYCRARAAPLIRTVERLPPEDRDRFLQGIAILIEELNREKGADYEHKL